MNTIIFKWSLAPEHQGESFEKYCPNCGKKVLFVDSQMRRRNANGKDIYEYAIYKCPKDHTWNESIRQYKASDSFSNESTESVESFDTSFQPLLIAECLEKGVQKIEIYLDSVVGKWRIDKLLADRISELSRTRIQEFIEAGWITINEQKIKPDEILKQSQKITLNIQFFHLKLSDYPGIT